MANIIYDAVSTKDPATSQSTTTFAHVVGSGINQILLVFIAIRDATTTVSGVTYNGVALSLAIGNYTTAPGNTGRLDCWYLKNPTQGTHNIIVTLSQSAAFGVTGISLNNVNVVEATAIATNVGTDPSVNITTIADNALVLDASLNLFGSATFTPGTSQTERSDFAFVTGLPGGSMTVTQKGAITPASTTTMTEHATNSDTWAQVAVSLSPSDDIDSLVLSWGLDTTPAASTKGLVYRVVKQPLPQKSLKYTVKKAKATTLSLAYEMREALIMDVKLAWVQVTTYPVTTALKYTVKHPLVPTQSVKYTTLSTPSSRTKGVRYTTLTTPAAKTNTLKYTVKKVIGKTKSLSYAVKTVLGQTKSVRYDLKLPVGHFTKQLYYTVNAKMQYLQDDFEFGGNDSGKWDNWGGSQIDDSGLNLALTSTIGAAYYGRTSLAYYNLIGSSAFIQVLDAGNQAIPSFEFYPLSLPNGANSLAILLSGNVVSARKKLAGVSTTVGSTVTYNASIMKWFRIRESAGTTYWEYATDPTGVWTVIASVANPFTLTQLKGEVIIGTWQTESSTTTAKVDNFNLLPNALQFSWKGYSWNRRIHIGDPNNFQNWSPSNITGPDGSNYLTFKLTNPTLNNPIGAELFSVQRGFGYGTYILTIGTRLDNVHPAASFGGMFLFDFTNPPAYREIDIDEIRPYNGITNKQILKNHAYNSGGVRQFTTDNMDYPSDVVQTHRLIWQPNKLTFDSFLGAGIGGSNYFHAEHTTNLPTPGLERVHINIFVDTSITSFVTATPLDVIVQGFSFTPFRVSKTLSYTVKKIPVTTKGLKYTVLNVGKYNKALQYVIASATIDDLKLSWSYFVSASLTKNSKYTIKKLGNVLTKSTKYTIRPVALLPTKILSYCVLASPFKQSVIVYTVKAPHRATRSLWYTVVSQPALSYLIDESGNYIVDEAGNKIVIIPANTKSLRYVVKAPVSKTKTLRYLVGTFTTTKTKGLQYFIKEIPSLTKPLWYVIRGQAIAMQRPDRYAVVKHYAVTRGLIYQLQVTTSSSITKALQYEIGKHASVTKSMGYKVKPSNLFIKLFRYAIRKQISLTKSSKYTVTAHLVPVKTIKYTILTSSNKTKSLHYAIDTKTNPSLVSTYTVVKHISKTTVLKYTTLINKSVTRTLTYFLPKAGVIVKTLSYSVPEKKSVTKSLLYKVNGSHIYNRVLVYEIIKTKPFISKSVTYFVQPKRMFAVTKLVKYTLKVRWIVSRNLTYFILAHRTNITKSTPYRIKVPITQIKRLQYVMSVAPTHIGKKLHYHVKKGKYTNLFDKVNSLYTNLFQKQQTQYTTKYKTGQ